MTQQTTTPSGMLRNDWCEYVGALIHAMHARFGIESIAREVRTPGVDPTANFFRWPRLNEWRRQRSRKRMLSLRVTLAISRSQKRRVDRASKVSENR